MADSGEHSGACGCHSLDQSGGRGALVGNMGKAASISPRGSRLLPSDCLLSSWIWSSHGLLNPRADPLTYPSNLFLYCTPIWKQGRHSLSCPCDALSFNTTGSCGFYLLSTSAICPLLSISTAPSQVQHQKFSAGVSIVLLPVSSHLSVTVSISGLLSCSQGGLP